MYAHTYTVPQMRQLEGVLGAFLDSGALSDRDAKMAVALKEHLGDSAERAERGKRQGEIIIHYSEEEEVFMDGVHEALWGQG